MVSLTLTPAAPWQAAHTLETLALPASTLCCMRGRHEGEHYGHCEHLVHWTLLRDRGLGRDWGIGYAG